MSPGLTRNSVFHGQISIAQPKAGYRFSIDALLLADFARVNPGDTVVDLGSGVGVIALCLARRMGRGRILAVEVQPRLAECARINVAENPDIPPVEVLEMNWTELTPSLIGGPVHYAVCNPPYRKLGSGRVNPQSEEAAARHEVLGSAAAAAVTAARILGPGGRLAVIYPASRLAGLLTDLRDAGLEPKRLRLAHSRSGEIARLALVEARLGGHEDLTIEPPMFIYQNEKDYGEEVEAILSGGPSAGTTDRPVVHEEPAP